MVYIDKVIEVYCFDYEKFGCIFCLIMVYKKCDVVLLLDEFDEKDLDIFLKICIEVMK